MDIDAQVDLDEESGDDHFAARTVRAGNGGPPGIHSCVLAPHLKGSLGRNLEGKYGRMFPDLATNRTGDAALSELSRAGSIMDPEGRAGDVRRVVVAEVLLLHSSAFLWCHGCIAPTDDYWPPAYVRRALRPTAEARHERTWVAVAWTPWLVLQL